MSAFKIKFLLLGFFVTSPAFAAEKADVPVVAPKQQKQSQSTPSDPEPCTAAVIQAEKDLIEKLLKEVEKELKEKLPNIGAGWGGNVTGNGPKCNVVNDAFWPIWNKHAQGLQLKCLSVDFAFDPGWLPWDLAAHISMGIYPKGAPKGTRPRWEIDPWRNGHCEPGPVTGNPTNQVQ